MPDTNQPKDEIFDFEELDSAPEDVLDEVDEETQNEDEVDETEAEESEEADEEEEQEETDDSRAESDESAEASAQADAQDEDSEDEEYYSDEELGDIISHVTDGKVKNVSELLEKITALEQQTTKDPYEGLSEFSKKLIEWEKEGKSPLEYAKLASLDFSKMEPKEVLRQKFIRDNSDLDQKKAERLFELEYKDKYAILDEDEDADPDRVEAAKLKLEHESIKATKELSEWQKERMLPKEKGPDPEKVKADQEFVQKHKDTVKSRISGFKGLTIPVGEKDDFNYEVDRADVESISKWMEDPYNSFMPAVLQNEKGELDYDKMEVVMTFAANPEAYSAKLYDHGFTKGKESYVTARKNSTKPGARTQTTASQPLSEDEQLFQQWSQS